MNRAQAQAKKQAPSQPAPRDQRGMAKAIIIAVVALVVIVLAGGAGGYLYLQHAAGPAAKAKPEPPPAPIFVKVDPMTVNLAGGSHVLYIGLSLNVANDKTAKLVTAHMPEVRNRTLITLSDQDADKLAGADGKRGIAKTLRQALRKPYTAKAKPVRINDVLFTDFVVQ